MCMHSTERHPEEVIPLKYYSNISGADCRALSLSYSHIRSDKATLAHERNPGKQLLCGALIS